MVVLGKKFFIHCSFGCVYAVALRVVSCVVCHNIGYLKSVRFLGLMGRFEVTAEITGVSRLSIIAVSFFLEAALVRSL